MHDRFHLLYRLRAANQSGRGTSMVAPTSAIISQGNCAISCFAPAVCSWLHFPFTPKYVLIVQRCYSLLSANYDSRQRSTRLHYKAARFLRCLLYVIFDLFHRCESRRTHSCFSFRDLCFSFRSCHSGSGRRKRIQLLRRTIGS